MAPRSSWGKPVKSFWQKHAEIERCNDLRARIKTYCKQESLTQPEFAEKIRVSATQISGFMTGRMLSGSEVYKKSNNYLRHRMPLFKCEEERAKVANNKFVVRCNQN
jgi:transcriptional regulator with XRE-family HTH domain